MIMNNFNKIITDFNNFLWFFFSYYLLFFYTNLLYLRFCSQPASLFCLRVLLALTAGLGGFYITIPLMAAHRLRITLSFYTGKFIVVVVFSCCEVDVVDVGVGHDTSGHLEEIVWLGIAIFDLCTQRKPISTARSSGRCALGIFNTLFFSALHMNHRKGARSVS